VPASIAARTRTLSDVPLFQGLPQATMRRIAEVASHFDVPAGHVLIEANTAGSGMFVLEEGTVAVQVRGRRPLELGPGESLGELALLTAKGVRSARVQAKTPVRCLAIGREDFRRLLEQEPKLVLWLLETVATRLSETARASRS
jgi:CRP-like cAMP-binding protein